MSSNLTPARRRKLKKLWEKLTKLPKEKREELINTLDERTCLDLQYVTNPLNMSVNPKNDREKVVALSIIKMSELDQFHFALTSVVGYTFKSASEWESERAKSFPSETEGELAKEIVVEKNRVRRNKPIWLTRDWTDDEGKATWISAKIKKANHERKEAELLYKKVQQQYNTHVDYIKKADMAIRKLKRTIELIDDLDNNRIKAMPKGYVKRPLETIRGDIKSYQEAITQYKVKVEKISEEKESINVESLEEQIAKLKTELKQLGYKYGDLVVPDGELDEEDEHFILQKVKKKLGIKKTKEEVMWKERGIVSDFLHSQFAYDPNNHIYEGYMPLYEEKYRAKINDLERDERGMFVTDKYSEVVIPPRDTFARMQNYTTANYDYLRQATNDIYGKWDMFSNCVICHGEFPNMKKAKEWLHKKKELLDLSVMLVPEHKWVFIDAFQGNRDKIDLDTEETQLINQIIERSRDDERIGKELMAKKARKTGKTTEAAKKYSKKFPSKVTKMGVKSLDELAPKDVGKTPSDAVRVNVYNTGASRRGRHMKPKFKKWKFHVEAEAPEGGAEGHNAAQTNQK
jgi:hypothetical protein